MYTARLRDKTPMFPAHFVRAGSLAPTGPIESFDLVVTAPKRLGVQFKNHDFEFKKSESGNNDVFIAHYANLNTVAEDVAEVSQLDRVARYFISNFKTHDDLAKAVDHTRLSRPIDITGIRNRASRSAARWALAISSAIAVVSPCHPGLCRFMARSRPAKESQEPPGWCT